MDDLTPLQELAPLVRPRDLDELRDVVRRRRRTTALASVASAGAALAIIVTAASLGPRSAAPAPVAPEPSRSSTSPSSPTSSPTTARPTFPKARKDGTFRALTTEEMRSHPDATTEPANPPTGAPGVDARTWNVCLGDCSYDTRPPRQGERQRMLEVTSDDFETGAMHRLVPWDSNISHAVDDWYLVDANQRAPRLVNSRGDDVTLTRGSPTEPSAIAGPLVYSTQGVAWVDMGGRVLHTLNGTGPGGGWDWWGAADTWFWGSVYQVGDSGEVVQQGLTWRNPDGSFGVHMLPMGVTEWSTQTLRSARPGTMGAIEPGQPRLLHVSTDYGQTWDVRVLPKSWGSGTHVPGGWETWVDVWPTWETP